MDKVVLDTNVFVSAYFKPSGVSAKLVNYWILGLYDLVISDDILDEYLEILLRKGINSNLVVKLNQEISRKAIRVVPREKFSLIISDPDDDKFIDCAVSGKADIIISGDPHLLKIKKFRNIRILTVREYLDTFSKDLT